MATTGYGSSTPVSPAVITGQYTLSDLVNLIRERLDDVTGENLWSNDEITSYIDQIQKELCHSMDIIEDRTTAGICTVSVGIGFENLVMDPRILRITRATLASAPTTRLMICGTDYMDDHHSGWDNSTTPVTGTPTILIVSGLGNGVMRLYPASTATDTLNLVVYRMPLYTLDYDLHSQSALEIDKYADRIIDGVLAKAYTKQDADTMDTKKAAYHMALWSGKGGGKEMIRREVIRRSQVPMGPGPMAAWM